jgi:hypothetical protein
LNISSSVEKKDPFSLILQFTNLRANRAANGTLFPLSSTQKQPPVTAAAEHLGHHYKYIFTCVILFAICFE